MWSIYGLVSSLLSLSSSSLISLSSISLRFYSWQPQQRDRSPQPRMSTDEILENLIPRFNNNNDFSFADYNFHFDVQDVLPLVVVLGSLIALLQCLFRTPSALRQLHATVSRLDSLDAAVVELDFAHCLKTRTDSTSTSTTTSTTTKIIIQQQFEGFHSTGLAVWSDSVTLSCYLLRPLLLLSPENLHWTNTVSVPTLSSTLNDLQQVVALMPTLGGTKQQKWVEVGCGAGVLSLALSMFGGSGRSSATRLVATDGDERTCALASMNVRNNNKNNNLLRVMQCRWGNEQDHENVGKHSFDVVCGSDLTYWPAPMDLLLVTVIALVSKKKGGEKF